MCADPEGPAYWTEAALPVVTIFLTILKAGLRAAAVGGRLRPVARRRKPRRGMDLSLALNIAALVFSLAAILLSTTIALRQSRLMQHANLLPVMIDKFREFRAPEFRHHIVYIGRRLWEDSSPETTGMLDMGEEARSHTTPVATFFNTVGVLVANGVIDAVLVSSYMGGSVLRAWLRLAPYIRNERRRRDDANYYLFFENLVYLVSQNPPEKLNTLLKLKTMPESSPELERAAAASPDFTA
jgi:hypothetical protein